MEYENQVKALRHYNGPSYKMTREAADVIEELMAQVRDNDYLIQQQADEIERLRRDVKKQQEKMFELAKARELKEMEEIKTWVHQRGAVIVDYDIYEMLTHNYGRKPKRGEWIFCAGDGKTCCDGWECSSCGKTYHTNVPYFVEFTYCPNCGAKMEVQDGK